MTTITETIPTALVPATTFSNKYPSQDEERDKAGETSIPSRFALQVDGDLPRSGIPESALND